MSNISEESFKFAKKNKKEIRKQFIEEEIKSNEKPVFIFMAGAPGTGKTEWSKKLIDILKNMKKKTNNNKFFGLNTSEKAKVVRQAVDKATEEQLDMVDRNGGMKILKHYSR